MTDISSPSFNVSDPQPRLLSATSLELLLIELVPMAERLSEELSCSTFKAGDEEHREATFYRLESLGYRVGQGLVERLVAGEYRRIVLSYECLLAFVWVEGLWFKFWFA